MEGKQTSTPWRAQETASGKPGIIDADGNDVCKFADSDPGRAHRDLVIRSCNSNSDLTHALKEFVRLANEDMILATPEGYAPLMSALSAANAALAKAGAL